MGFIFRFLTGLLFFLGVFIVPAWAGAATHNVLPGESLYTISMKYSVSLNSLIEANGLKGSLIYPGQQLFIPGSNSGGERSNYKVREGDTLYLIGQKYNVSYQEIMRANNLHDSVIYPGMVLAIPAGRVAVPQISRGGYFQRPSLEDVDLLARLITAEADGEPYEGKVAVGAVVLNRVENINFPNTIPEVIYQYGDGTYQFEPVMNGLINKPASTQSVQAARDALNMVDPTNGALYFFAPNKVSNQWWLFSRPVSKVIGNHVFTY